MNNITLNVGGLIGALVGGAAAAIIEFVVLKRHENPNSSRIGKLFVAGIVGGAVAGNFLWGKIFPTKSA